MPSRIGRYAVRRRIGAGGFATVWLAYDEQLDSPVAVKVLAENWTEDHHVRQRFLEEGRFLRKVESPHVVSVYDAGELEDGRPYLVMSYADQGTLADRLEIDGLTAAQSLEVVRQVGAGLTALHERGVLHRDVKPANVLFRTVEARDGRPQVRAMMADLGLGKALDMSSRLTMIAGTPSFVAPEQAQGEPLDARADLYALGALTHLLLDRPGGLPPRVALRRRRARSAAGARPRGRAVPRRRRGGRPPRTRPRPRGALARRRVVRRGARRRALAPATEDGAGPLPGPWLPLDPHLTQPGPRPSSFPPGDELPEPVPPARSRDPQPGPARRGLRARARRGLGAGFVAHSAQDRSIALGDTTGSLSVTVPEAWTASVRTGQWTPPEQEGELPSLSAGTGADWAESDEGEGVFLGVLAVEDMPEELPGHEACEESLAPVSDVDGDDPVLTQVSTGCPGVIVERVRQVATDRYLWMQVRSADRSTAYSVLEGVSAPGF